ncbi:MAG: hypothetical protein RID53_02875 [Coleofasciculus sp. B1-GNL1-01]|uniref:hypothetical protein n=1 Tax=Coleofasciculus sp. B1-GNL1-01 TaxID=3068484 RepID=UPI0032FA7AD7
MSSFVDTMKQGEQGKQGKQGEILAVQLFLPSCTRVVWQRRGDEGDEGDEGDGGDEGEFPQTG